MLKYDGQRVLFSLLSEQCSRANWEWRNYNLTNVMWPTCCLHDRLCFSIPESPSHVQCFPIQCVKMIQEPGHSPREDCTPVGYSKLEPGVPELHKVPSSKVMERPDVEEILSFVALLTIKVMKFPYEFSWRPESSIIIDVYEALLGTLTGLKTEYWDQRKCTWQRIWDSASFIDNCNLV